MTERVQDVEQFNALSASRPAADAGAMDLRTGKMSALSAGGWIGADRALDGDTADTKAAVMSSQNVDCERVTDARCAFCHTFAGVSELVLKGGEGVAGAVRPAFHNTFRRAKFMRIAQADQPAAQASPAMPAGYRKNKKGGRAVVVVVGAASVLLWRKSLLAREKDSGAICAVRLTTHGASADQFTPGMQLDCIATASAVFEYDGKSPT